MSEQCHPWNERQVMIHAHSDVAHIGSRQRLEAMRIGGSVLDVVWCESCGGLITFTYSEAPEMLPTEQIAATDRLNLIRVTREIASREGGLLEIDISTSPATNAVRTLRTFVLRRGQWPTYSIGPLGQPEGSSR